MDAVESLEPESPIREGQILEGKFRVERIIGEGAMGLVVEATHLSLDERVALKFLRQEGRARPDVAARFAREARAAVKIKSDHVARVFDVGSTDDGTPFIVMEFLEGSDLASILEVRQQLEIQEAVEYVIQACEGLAEAHARGIIHRDIKPENMFLAQSAGTLRQIKLLDFGISKTNIGVTGGEDAAVASGNTTQIMGSPHYMSPDQIRSTHDVDARADIWSLGVVLYELISGEMPFPAPDVTALIAQILHEPHTPVSTHCADVPSGLKGVIDRCLSKDPAQRFEGAADLAVALLPFGPKRARATVEKAVAIARSSGRADFRPDLDADSKPPPAAAMRSGAVPVAAAAPPPPSSSKPVTATALATPVMASAQQKRPGAGVWVIAGLVVLVGLGAGIFAIVSAGGSSSAKSGTPATSVSAVGGSWSSIPADPSTAATVTTTTPPANPTTDSPTTATTTTTKPTAIGGPPLRGGGGGFVARPPGVGGLGGGAANPPPQATSVAKPPPTPKPAETDIRMER